MNPIIAGLMASAALAVIVIGYFVFSVPITSVFNSLNGIFPNVSLNGVSMSNFTANQFALWGAAITLSIIAVIIWFFAASNADENDSFEGSF